MRGLGNGKIIEIDMSYYMLSFRCVNFGVCFSITAQAHSSVERAGLLGGVHFRLLESDSKHQLRGETLADAIRADKEKGLIPFYVRAEAFLTNGNL